jgi:hypothetical protein
VRSSALCDDPKIVRRNGPPNAAQLRIDPRITLCGLFRDLGQAHPSALPELLQLGPILFSTTVDFKPRHRFARRQHVDAPV